MAIQKTFTTSSELTINDAYIRIVSLSYATSSNLMSIVVGVFTSRAAAETGKPPVETSSYAWDGFDRAAPDNAHTQIYNWLLSLSEYAGGVPVLEPAAL